MFYLPQYYFGDISAEEMKEIMDGMPSESEVAAAQCESLNHQEHHGELWQCTECLRVLCWEEGGDDGNAGLCDDCWVRLRSGKRVISFA